MLNGIKIIGRSGFLGNSKSGIDNGFLGLGNDLNTKINSLTLDFAERSGITDENEIWITNNTVRSLKQNPSILDSVKDGFFYPVSQTSYGAALHNLMSSKFTLSGGAAPAYGKNGFFFDGMSQYLKTGYVPSIEMKLNVGFTLLYIRNNATGTFGSVGSSTQHWYVQARNTSDNARFSAYSHATLYNVANNDSTGIFIFGILANNYRYIMKDGVVLGISSTTVTGTLPPYELYLGARYNGGTGLPDSFANNEIATAIQGNKYLSISDAMLLTRIVRTHNNSLGR